MDLYTFRKSSANKPGLTEAFVNVNRNDPIQVFAPPGDDGTWILKGVKFYTVDTISMRSDKDRDVSSLSSGNKTQFESVFDTAVLPSGFSVTGQGSSMLTITDSGDGGQCYEFLLWLQDPNDDNNNDYVDPGIRNNWAQ